MAEGEVGAVAPVVDAPAANAVPAPDAPTGQENAEAKADESVQPQPKYTDDDLQKKINERLTKERKRIARDVRLELERDHYKQQAEALANPAPKQQSQGEDPEPREEDYAGKPYRDFLKAQSRWEARQEMKAERDRQSQQAQQGQQTQRAQQNAQYIHEKLLAKGLEKYPDFESRVLAEDVPISPAMVAVAAKLDNGYDVLYHLVNDEAELGRIARLSDIEQAWELRDFSTKLKAPAKPTQTPPPIVPNASKTTVEKRLQDADVDEFFAIRKRQIAAKKGR